MYLIIHAWFKFTKLHRNIEAWYKFLKLKDKFNLRFTHFEATMYAWKKPFRWVITYKVDLSFYTVQKTVCYISTN